MANFTSMSSSLRRFLNVGYLRKLPSRAFVPRKFSTIQHQACAHCPLFGSAPFRSGVNVKLYSTITSEGIVKSSYTVDIPEVSINDFVVGKFDEYGDDLAIIDGVSGISYSYRELKTSIKKLGSALTKKGFKKGDVFALFLPNVPEYPILFFGVTALGGVVTTLNPTYTAEEVAFQLKDSGAEYIATIPDFAEPAKKAAIKVGIKDVFVIGETNGCTPISTLLSDDGLACPEDVPINPKEDVCVIPYSSGTTSFPKGVMLTHHNLVSQMCVIKHESVRPCPMRGVALAFLPFFHIFGMMVVMTAFLERGGKIVGMMKFDGELMLQHIQDYKVNALYIVPPVATFLAKHPSVEQYDLTSLDTVISGAAPLGEEIIQLIKKRLPSLPVLGQGYGLTETSPAAMLCPRYKLCKSSGVGIVLPNIEGKVIDVKTGEPLGPHQNGEVCIRGPIVMKGYLNNPKATAKSITPEGWFHSGDIGHYDEDGYFFIVDRLKDLIKYKGFQVSPAELEALLHTHPNVQDAAVIGIPCNTSGELPKAFIVPKGDITETEVVDFVSERVAPLKKLRGGVEFVEQIPKTASGKILKRDLRK